LKIIGLYRYLSPCGVSCGEHLLSLPYGLFKRSKIMVQLKEKDYALYRLLEVQAKDYPNTWLSKEELISRLPYHFQKKEGTHDICAELNNSRLRLNKARAEGRLSHVVLLKSHKFKLATSREELEEYAKRDFINGLKLLKRYWQNIGAIREDGQGKFIDCRGNIIDDDSLAKRFNEPFNF
jgi:hypothetical protein